MTHHLMLDSSLTLNCSLIIFSFILIYSRVYLLMHLSSSLSVTLSTEYVLYIFTNIHVMKIYNIPNGLEKTFVLYIYIYNRSNLTGYINTTFCIIWLSLFFINSERLIILGVLVNTQST